MKKQILLKIVIDRNINREIYIYRLKKKNSTEKPKPKQKWNSGVLKSYNSNVHFLLLSTIFVAREQQGESNYRFVLS